MKFRVLLSGFRTFHQAMNLLLWMDKAKLTKLQYDYTIRLIGILARNPATGVIRASE